MFFLLGLSIALAAMLLVNSISSLVVSLLWKAMAGRAKEWNAGTRARVLCALRLFPVAIGIICVGLLLVPAYFVHEPRDSHEDISFKLAVVSLFSAVGIGLALLRGFMSWRVTSRLSAEWLEQAQPVPLSEIDVPTYSIEHAFPLIAIVGTLRPRLFIAKQVFQALTSEELSATIQHEAGHIIARDNLKRSLIRACRDTLLLIPCGRPLDAAWKDASESAADEHAARGGPSVALSLAAALVKIARMIPPGGRPAMPAAAMLIGDEQGSVGERVRRLLHLANSGNQAAPSALVQKAPSLIALALTILVAAFTTNEPHVLAVVHSLIEHGVHFLQ